MRLNLTISVMVSVLGILNFPSRVNFSSPNIVWVMADDLGWGELEVFPGGSTHGRIDTPNLNQFAAEGMQFLNAYAGYTVCAPSRTALATSLASALVGLGFFTIDSNI